MTRGLKLDPYGLRDEMTYLTGPKTLAVLLASCRRRRAGCLLFALPNNDNKSCDRTLGVPLLTFLISHSPCLLFLSSSSPSRIGGLPNHEEIRPGLPRGEPGLDVGGSFLSICTVDRDARSYLFNLTATTAGPSRAVMSCRQC